MASSGQVARNAPGAATLAGNARRAPSSGFDQHMAQRLVRLGLLRHMLLSPRFYERVAVAAIAIAALKGLGQQNSATMVARLAAWNKREIQRLERKVERKAVH
jgi:hypothetical protein